MHGCGNAFVRYAIIRMDNLKRILLSLFLILVFVRPQAKENTDSVYPFRFIPGKDMFFVPWNGNGENLDRLLAAIESNRAAIDNGQMYLCVTSRGQGGKLSRIRRNRVKSELILRGKIKEENFVTDKEETESYDGEQELVVVLLPAPVEKVARIAGMEAAARVEAYHRMSAQAETASSVPVTAKQPKTEVPCPVDSTPAQEDTVESLHQVASTRPVTSRPYSLALRANLLRWITLTPDLGIEWRISRNVGILANGSWTSWSLNDKRYRYALWELSPEIRLYSGESRDWYVGAMYKTGHFNYKLSETGRQGDINGGAITGGYQLKLNKALSLDFAIGLGYISADTEKYRVIDGVRVRQGRETRHWYGPVDAAVTLMWRL